MKWRLSFKFWIFDSDLWGIFREKKPKWINISLKAKGKKENSFWNLCIGLFLNYFCVFIFYWNWWGSSFLFFYGKLIYFEFKEIHFLGFLCPLEAKGWFRPLFSFPFFFKIFKWRLCRKCRIERELKVSWPLLLIKVL